MEETPSKEESKEQNNEEHFYQLGELIRKGDGYIDTVKRYISEHQVTPELYCKSKTRKGMLAYPVKIAAESGHVNILNHLISQGFEPNIPISDCYIRRYPIQYACRNGHLAVVESLVKEHGVNPDTMDSDGETALIMGIYGGHLNIVKVLVENGASVNGVMATDLNPPLHVAIQRNEVAITEYLISVGADVNRPNSWNLLPISLVSDFPGTKIAEMLLESGADVEANSKYDTPFVMATKVNNLELLKLLTKFGANPESVTSEGYTPLQMSIWKGFYAITRYLVLKVNVNLKYREGKWNPLVLALNSINPDFAVLLLEAGCRVIPSALRFVKGGFKNEDLRHRIVTPRPLKLICAIKIRSQLGKRLHNKGSYLPLPRMLLDYLLMEHVV